MDVPPVSRKLLMFRLVFGGIFTALGIWATARVSLQLEDIHAAWPDWLALLFPAIPLSLGIVVLVGANRPYEHRPYLRTRSGAARVFGSTMTGFFFVSILLRHLFRQHTLAGVIGELAAAALVVGLSALVFGAINADARDRENAARK